MGHVLCPQIGLQSPEGREKKVIWVDCGIHVGSGSHQPSVSGSLKRFVHWSIISRINMYSPSMSVFGIPSLLRLCTHIKVIRSWSRCCRTLTSMLLLYSMWMDTYSAGSMTVWVLVSFYNSEGTILNTLTNCFRTVFFSIFYLFRQRVTFNLWKIKQSKPKSHIWPLCLWLLVVSV